MVNILRCPSSGYSYTYSGVSKTGTGRNEEAARADALTKFPKDAESEVKKKAIDDATKENDCASPCQLDVTVGTATFVQTNKTEADSSVTVTVTIQVPVTLSCVKRQVVALASLTDNPVLLACTALRAIPISEVNALSPFRDDLSALRIKDIGDLLREASLAADDRTSLYQPVKKMLEEKFKTTIRAILGVSFRTRSEKRLSVAVVLPGSPAEVAGLMPGDELIQIGETTVSDFGDVRDSIANLRAPVTLSVTIHRKDAVLKIELKPGFYIFPYQSFSPGVKFNKFCDDNCDCTIDQPGFLCATVYVCLGEGPNGGVLLRKVCGAQEAGLPRIDVDCGVGEYF
jgi:hypothetical protein